MRDFVFRDFGNASISCLETLECAISCLETL